jgi:5-methylcytosine-specific restriction endonuclease McrA
MSRKTFDSSAYYEARNNFDGYCLGCGKRIGFTKALILTKSGDLRQSDPPNGLMCCDRKCERLFIKKTIKDWSRIREEVLARDSYTCQDCGRSVNRTIAIFRFVRRSNMRLSQPFPKEPRVWWKFQGRFEVEDPVELEVHHIVPISEGGPEFDLDNLVTLCFECHHLGRHGAKIPTPEEAAQKKAEAAQNAEQDRLQAARSQHRCLDMFYEVPV